MKKQQVPAWITKRVSGAKVRVTSTLHRFSEHAILEILKPVVVYKWVFVRHKIQNRYGYTDRRTVVELKLPVGTRVVVHKLISKCRANQAKYLGKKKANSSHNWTFRYVPGRIVRARLSPMTDDCGSGIHFCFRKRQVSRY